MGAIWLAEHERLRSEVVVKFIIGEDATQDEARARFEREATLAARAKSPHVVQVFDHGATAEGVPYIAMERLVGEDLATRMSREGPIRPDMFVEWFRQAAAGLARAHAKQIVHRDLKPENIFLCNEDGAVLVKLLDFGIAKGGAAGSGFGGTMTGAMLGTVHYMSPEQTMGASEVDLRSDLWAMGVVTYFALTGRLPFTGDGLGVIVTQISLSEPPAPSSIIASLPVELDVWMRKALAKDPKSRFQSAREMAGALGVAILGHDVDAVRDFSLRADTPRPPEGQRNVTTLAPATSRGSWAFLPPPKRTRHVLAAVLGGALLTLALIIVRKGQTPELVPAGVPESAPLVVAQPVIESPPMVGPEPALDVQAVKARPASRTTASRSSTEVATKKKGVRETGKTSGGKKASELTMSLE